MPAAYASDSRSLDVFVLIMEKVIHAFGKMGFLSALGCGIAALAATVILTAGCGDRPELDDPDPGADMSRITSEVEAAVWAFHRADTARDAEAVINLLWPDFAILVDGSRQDYAQVSAGSREFMATLEFFHTQWHDLQIIPLGPDAAIASFQFRDSIMTRAGDLIRSSGPTTFVWERRQGEWRLRFADADHYPINR